MMLFTERRYYATLNPAQKVLHRLFRIVTTPQFMWPLWRQYRVRWPNPRLPR